MRGICLLFWVPVLASAADPDAAVVLQKAVEAERENRHRAENFLFREVINYSQANLIGEMVLQRSTTFEVTFIEGEPFHRMVAIDGQPLPQELELAEQKRVQEVAEYRRRTPLDERRKKRIAAEGRRFRIDLRLIGEYHESRFAGQEMVNSRPAWIIETAPKPGTRRPRNRGEWALAQRCKYWIDQQTYHPLRLISTQIYDWDEVTKGAVTESVWTNVDGVWLVAGIHSASTVPKRKPPVATETAQIYSNYRKFTTTTAITFEGLELTQTRVQQ